MALKAGFLIGGDTNETPQSLARKRALIAQIMANGRAPTNIGEGLNALGDGIVANVLERRAGKAEAAGQASANEAFAPIAAMFTGGGFGGMGGTSAPASSAPSSTPSPAGQPPVPGLRAEGGGMEAYRNAIASIESAGSGDYAAVGPTHPKLGRALGRYQVMEANIGPWSQEVLGRTVTPDEFMANPQLQDQIFDGKFQSYVSKFGPEGAAQAWFGGPGGVGKTDRKDSLGTSIGAYGQKFSNALGSAPASAAEAVTAMGQGGQMPEPQAAAYVDPMVVNPNSRPQAMAPQQGPTRNGLPFDLVSGSPQLARADTRQGILRALTGQTGPEPGATGAFPSAPVSAPMATPQAAPAPSMAAPAPMQAAPAAAPAPQPMAQPQISSQQLIAAINNPWLSDSQRAIAQSMLEQQMQANDPMRQLQLQKAQLELAQMQNPQADIPDSVRALELRAQAAGLKPGTKEYSDFMLSGGDKGITVDARQMGNIPPGYKADYDANGNVISLSPIPGSPADVEAQAARDKKELSKNMQAGKADVVTQDIDRAIEVMSGGVLPDTGAGAFLSSIPGTDAKRLSGLLDTIKANVSFDTLNQMRQASPTGGALGSVTENELRLLQSAIGSLDQSQDPATLKDNLNRVWNMYQDTVHGPGNGPARRPLSFDRSAAPAPAAMDLSKPISEMTDAELEALANGN